MKRRQIIGFGGEFLKPDRNRALEKYVLGAVTAARPKICFIGTASGDDREYREQFFQAFGPFNCELLYLGLFEPVPRDLRALILSCDIICVGGGNTRSMLALWREWEIDIILREAWQAGIVLTGESAGMLCWFAQCLIGAVVDEYSPIPGLGFLPFSASPHYDVELARRPAFTKLIAAGVFRSGFGVNNGAGLHFVNEELVATVSLRATAHVYRVHARNGAAEEEIVPGTVLAPEHARVYDLKQRVRRNAAIRMIGRRIYGLARRKPD